MGRRGGVAASLFTIRCTDSDGASEGRERSGNSGLRARAKFIVYPFGKGESEVIRLRVPGGTLQPSRRIGTGSRGLMQWKSSWHRPVGNFARSSRARRPELDRLTSGPAASLRPRRPAPARRGPPPTSSPSSASARLPSAMRSSPCFPLAAPGRQSQEVPPPPSSPSCPSLPRLPLRPAHPAFKRPLIG